MYELYLINEGKNMQNHYILNYLPNIKSIFKLSLLLCLLNCYIINKTIAQSNPKGVIITNTPDTSKKGNTWALIVGISKYQNVQGLNYADKDALAFYDYLVNKKGLDKDHIQLLVNEKAIASNIYQALDLLTLSIKENDRVIFYFSGHGDVETKTIYQNGFLLAYDAPVAVYMAKGAIGITYLQQYLETFVAKKAKDVLLIVDACRSGKLAGGSEGIQITMHSLGQTWNNQIINVLSAQEGESSFEDKKWGGGRGVFSYYLVKGLEGLANRNADSVITTAELAAYLPFAVGDATNSVQNPTVSGNPKTNLFTFNKTLLAFANEQDNKPGTGEILAAKGSNDELDPEIAKWYNQYRTYLQKGRLIWGEKQTDTINCAKHYYLKLVKDKRAKTILPSLKSSFISSLKHKTEVVLEKYINNYLKADKLDEEYNEMKYAISLVDHSYVLYNYLKARALFLQAYNTKEPLKSIKLLKRVIQIEPDASYAYNELGIKFDNQLDIIDSAIYYYKKALYLSPTWSITCNQLGYYLSVNQKFNDAVYYLEKGLKLDSTNYSIYRNLASDYNVLYHNEKKGDSILEVGLRINKALIEKDSTQIIPYYTASLFLYDKHDFKNAVILLNKRIELLKKSNPQDSSRISNTYELLGHIYCQPNFENYKEALLNANFALKYNPKADQTYRVIAYVYQNLKKYDKAIENIKKAIKLDPQYNFYYVRLCDIYLLNKDYLNAFRTSNKALKIHPEKIENYSQFLKVCIKLKKYKYIEIYYNKALKLKNLNSDFFNEIAGVYYDEKDYINSTKFFLEAIKMQPEENSNYYNVACNYSLINNPKQSLQYLEISLQKGYKDLNHINEDSDLTNIRQLPQFKELMKKYFPDKIK